MATPQKLSDFIWQIADLLRGPYLPRRYERVIVSLNSGVTERGFADDKEVSIALRKERRAALIAAAVTGKITL